MFQVDGEALWFTNFVKMEAVPRAVEIIVDYNELMQQKGMLGKAQGQTAQ